MVSWSEEESGRSSTFLELRAIWYVLESYNSHLHGKEVCHRDDNRNAEIIMSVGSPVPDLHREAVLVNKLCCELKIRLSVEWVSPNDNKQLFICFWSEIFTFINRQMHTFDLLIVKGDTSRLLIVKCVNNRECYN